MIAQIIEVLDAIAGARLKAVQRYGLVELLPIEGSGTAPHEYKGGGSWTPITVDSGGDWSYWRITEKIKEYPDTRITACDMITQEQSLRLVTLVGRELCGPESSLARAAGSDMRKAAKQLRTATRASIVEITKSEIELDTAKVFQQEFQGAGRAVNPDKALIAIDLIVKVTGKEECFDVCGTPLDLICALIDKATNAKVVECLGPTRVNEICDADCPTMCEQIQDSDPFEVTECMPHDWATATLQYVMLWPETTDDGIVEAIGNSGHTDGVRDLLCVTCPYDGIIQINGVQVGTFGPFDPCVDNTLNIVLQ